MKSIEENNEIRKELLHAVEDLSDEKLNEALEKGRWTIMQVLDHLYLMEKTVTHTIRTQLEKGETRKVKDKPIEVTVDRSTKVEAPSFVQPAEDFITLEQMKEKLLQSRESLTDLAENADDHLLEQRTAMHPIFGEISLKQWIPFVGYHEKRHLEQIEELKVHIT